MRTVLSQLQPREKRALAGLAAAAMIFLAMQFLVLPAWDNAAKLRASLPLKEKQLRKYQAMVRLAGARESDWQNFQARLSEAEKGLLNSRVAAVASAELQELMKQLMAAQGIEMRSADFLPVRAVQAGVAQYAAVPLSLQFECTVDQLAGFLLAARGSGKTLALDQLSITPAPRPDKKKVVTVRIVIHAIMQVEPAPATATQ